MSSYEPTSPISYDNESLNGRTGTPDILEPEDLSFSGAAGGGFNLADELAAAEDSEHENENGFLVAPQNRMNVIHSDYEGSEYGDIDDDSDGYLSDHVDLEEQQLNRLVEEYSGDKRRHGVIGKFIEELRNMRGQMEVENNIRRYLLQRYFLLIQVDYNATLTSVIARLSSPCSKGYTVIIPYTPTR